MGDGGDGYDDLWFICVNQMFIPCKFRHEVRRYAFGTVLNCNHHNDHHCAIHWVGVEPSCRNHGGGSLINSEFQLASADLKKYLPSLKLT